MTPPNTPAGPWSPGPCLISLEMHMDGRPHRHTPLHKLHKTTLHDSTTLLLSGSFLQFPLMRSKTQTVPSPYLTNTTSSLTSSSLFRYQYNIIRQYTIHIISLPNLNQYQNLIFIILYTYRCKSNSIINVKYKKHLHVWNHYVFSVLI